MRGPVLSPRIGAVHVPDVLIRQVLLRGKIHVGEGVGPLIEGIRPAIADAQLLLAEGSRHAEKLRVGVPQHPRRRSRAVALGNHVDLALRNLDVLHQDVGAQARRRLVGVHVGHVQHRAALDSGVVDEDGRIHPCALQAPEVIAEHLLLGQPRGRNDRLFIMAELVELLAAEEGEDEGDR